MHKIMHIASGDLWAGAEVQLYNLASELDKRDDIVLRVILLNHGVLETRLQQRHVNVQVVDETRLGSVAIAKSLIKAMQDFRPDVVHTHRQKENILGAIAARLSGVGTCVRTVHGQPEFNFKPWQFHKHAYRLLDHLCGRWLQDRIIAVSLPLSQYLACEFPADRIVTIENGINIDEVISNSQIPLTAPLPGKADSTKVCIVCRLTPVKRLDTFLEIAKQVLASASNDFDFYIFGDGPLEATISENIRKNGLEGSVHMMGFQSNIPAYMNLMDILLITSDHEGLPMNLLEAMALRLPVISNCVGGIPHALDNGQCGRLITNQNIAEYSQAIDELITNPEIYKSYTRTAYERVQNINNTVNCARQHINIYTKLIFLS